MTGIQDIACVVFCCTAANHLGLIDAVQAVTRCRLPIVSCAKCFSFWAVLTYCLSGGTGAVTSLAVSFLSAWSAVWLDLLMGIIDRLYLTIYEQIYPTADPSDADAVGAGDAVPGMPGGQEAGAGSGEKAGEGAEAGAQTPE